MKSVEHVCMHVHFIYSRFIRIATCVCVCVKNMNGAIYSNRRMLFGRTETHTHSGRQNRRLAQKLGALIGIPVTHFRETFFVHVFILHVHIVASV